jgi:hypothetical protein
MIKIDDEGNELVKLDIKEPVTLESVITAIEDMLTGNRESHIDLYKKIKVLENKETDSVTIKRTKSQEVSNKLDAFVRYLSVLEREAELINPMGTAAGSAKKEIKVSLKVLCDKHNLNKNQKHYLIPYLEKDQRFNISHDSRMHKFVSLVK